MAQIPFNPLFDEQDVYIEEKAMNRFIVIGSLLLLGSLTCHADEFIYANNASYGSPYVYQIDLTTGGNITHTYTNLSGNNGRGSVVVGNTLYYTTAGSGSVYSYNLITMTDNGPLFSVAGASALSTIAYDGTNFIIGDYSGTNQVFTYTPTGTLVSTVSLGNCSGNCDGLEYFLNGGTPYLVSNRGDAVGPYDMYTLNLYPAVEAAKTCPTIDWKGVLSFQEVSPDG